MASQPDTAELQSLLERLISSRNRDLSFFIPFLLDFSAAFSDPDTVRPEPSRSGSDPDEESGDRSSPDESTPRERIVLINPLTQGMLVIEGTGIDSLFRGAGEGKGGQPPASKSSVEAMARVVIGEGEEGGECVVCLDEFGRERIVKEMPCKHRFHGECIEKWLGIHGSCPVCRYTMPVDEKMEERESGEDDRRRVNREIWVSFFGRAGRRRDGNGGDNRSSVADQTVEGGGSDHIMS